MQQVVTRPRISRAQVLVLLLIVAALVAGIILVAATGGFSHAVMADTPNIINGWH